MFDFRAFGEVLQGSYEFFKYGNGRLAVQLNTEDPDDPSIVDRYAVLSVNIPEADIGEDEFAAKHWSENAGFIEQLEALGHFEDTGKRTSSGYVNDIRIMRLTPLGKEMRIEWE